MTERSCSRCIDDLAINLDAVMKSWEDADKNRYFPVSCPRGHAECRPVVVHDGGNGSRRYDIPLSV